MFDLALPLKLSTITIILFPSVLLAAIFYVTTKLSIKRRDDLKNLAVQNGFSFEKTASSSFIFGNLNRFKLITGNTVHSKHADNILKIKKNGLMWEIFDYSYSLPGQRYNKKYARRETVIQIPLNKDLPIFSLRPSAKIFNIDTLGSSGIKFEDRSEFSKKYSVHGNDENRIKTLLTPSFRNLLMATETKPYISYNGNILAIFIKNKILSPVSILSFVDYCSKIIEEVRKN